MNLTFVVEHMQSTIIDLMIFSNMLFWFCTLGSIALMVNTLISQAQRGSIGDYSRLKNK